MGNKIYKILFIIDEITKESQSFLEGVIQREEEPYILF